MNRSEKIAQLVFKRNDLKLPVDIENLAKAHTELKFIHFPDYFKLDGICFKKGTRPKILVNTNLAANRMRFTIAHELGHLFIPSHIGVIPCSIDDLESSENNVNWHFEREANEFASELLIPKTWVRDVIKEHLNSNSTEIFHEVIRKAKVSVEAACISISKCLPPHFVCIIHSTYFKSPKYYYSYGMSKLICNKDYLNPQFNIKPSNSTVTYIENYKVELLDFN